MKLFRMFTIFLLLRSCLFPINVKDAFGRVHHFNKPPNKVISISPAVTDTIVMLGMEKILVGVSTFSELEGVKKIGGILNPNVEIIKNLNPEIVLVMQPTPLSLIKSIERSGVEVFPLKEPKNMEEIAQMVIKLGKIFSKKRKAEKIAENFLREVSPVSKRKGKAYIGFVEPPFWTACRGTFLDDLISRAGWENICEIKGWTALSGEEIHIKNPDLIIIPGRKKKKEIQYLLKFPWNGTSAVKTGKVLVINENLLLRPSPLISKAYKEILKVK